MSTVDVKSSAADPSPAWQPPQPSNEFEYRSISKASIASLVFTILGLASFLGQAFVLLPLLGIVFAIVALASIRKNSHELLGVGIARLGLIASSVALVGSVAMHSYVYATEVPDGYQRMTFWDLRDNARTQLPFSERALELDGKKVFLKGYVRPSAKKVGLQDFILVGDFGDCCFGGNPKITEIVEVNIKSDDRVDYSYALRKIGGVFRLNKSTKPVNETDIPRVYYQIEADYIR